MPYTTYRFRLKVYNDIGASPNSQTSDQTTTEQESKLLLHSFQFKNISENVVVPRHSSSSVADDVEAYVDQMIFDMKHLKKLRHRSIEFAYVTDSSLI